MGTRFYIIANWQLFPDIIYLRRFNVATATVMVVVWQQQTQSETLIILFDNKKYIASGELF